jgi:hypothetical protein
MRESHPGRGYLLVQLDATEGASSDANQRLFLGNDRRRR